MTGTWSLRAQRSNLPPCAQGLPRRLRRLAMTGAWSLRAQRSNLRVGCAASRRPPSRTSRSNRLIHPAVGVEAFASAARQSVAAVVVGGVDLGEAQRGLGVEPAVPALRAEAALEGGERRRLVAGGDGIADAGEAGERP